MLEALIEGLLEGLSYFIGEWIVRGFVSTGAAVLSWLSAGRIVPWPKSELPSRWLPPWDTRRDGRIWIRTYVAGWTGFTVWLAVAVGLFVLL